MKPIAVLGYIDVYKTSLPDDHFGYVSRYPTDLLILYLSKINSILFQEEDRRTQTINIFKYVFIKKEGETPDYESIVTKLINHDHEIIFCVQPISYLIRAVLAQYKSVDESDPIDIKDFHSDLFKTILIYNTLVYQMDVTQLESYRGLWKLAIQQQSYFRDFNALLYTAPIKFMLIQRYLNSTEEGRKILLSFQQNLSLGNFWNFAKTFMDLVQTSLGKNRTGHYILNRNQVPEQVLTHFSYVKGQRNNELSIHKDIIPKPFYLLDDDHIAIIDFSYFRYLLDQGIFWFIFYNSFLKKGYLYKNFIEFRASIGIDYFEQFLVKNLLKNIFHKRSQILISTKVFQDFWVKPSSKELIIVEVKMADLNPLTAESFDLDKFENFIVANYAKPKDSSGGAKGVYQLMRQFNLLQKLTGEIKQIFKLNSLHNLVVYPLIIYSDQILDSPGINAFVQEKFIQALKSNGVYSFQIKPLTMIGVNTLLEHFKLFKEDWSKLTSMISAYHKYLARREKEYAQFPEPNSFYELNLSFTAYIAKREGYSKKTTLDNLAVFRKLTDAGAFG